MNETASIIAKDHDLDWLNYGSILTDDRSVPLAEADVNQASDIGMGWHPTVKKTIGWFSLNSLVFGTTAFYIGYEWFLGSRSIKSLSLCAFVNGATLPPYIRLALRTEHWEIFNRIANRLAYPTVYTFSQVDLNLNYPASQAKYYNLPFIVALGYLTSKNVIAIFSGSLSDLPFSTQTPEIHTLLPTLGFTTRDRSCPATTWLGVCTTAALGAAVANFILRDRYSTWGDMGKIGFYQDMTAIFFVGNILGDKIARVFDDHKEKLEIRHTSTIVSERKLSGRLKFLRLLKNGFVLFNPLLIGIGLAIPVAPNSNGAFVCKSAVGALLGAQTLIDLKEFEKANSPVHANYRPLGENNVAVQTTCAKVTKVSKKFANYAFLTGFTIYTAVLIPSIALDDTVPAADKERLTVAVSVAWTATLAFFLMTFTLATRYKPTQNNDTNRARVLENLQESNPFASMPLGFVRRILNELKWRLEHSPTSLAALPQYLLILLNIGDESLQSDSNELYILSVIAWIMWGLAVGNETALAIHKRTILISSSLATIVLAKVFVENLQDPKM